MSRNNSKARESILEDTKEREPESAQFLLLEPRVKGEEFAQPSKEIAGAKGMDAVL